MPLMAGPLRAERLTAKDHIKRIRVVLARVRRIFRRIVTEAGKFISVSLVIAHRHEISPSLRREVALVHMPHNIVAENTEDVCALFLVPPTPLAMATSPWLFTASDG